ncbi:MAG: glutaminase A [Rhizobiales bacterium NRL2]|jgi:glutaminase|nr:MAG: glutaminase A [Rhizobiales bacterium NRL2]
MTRPVPDRAAIEAALDEAYQAGLAKCAHGHVATYIPELARVDPSLFGIAVHTVDGVTASIGDAAHPFTMQSVSKIFSLSAVIEHSGERVFEHMSTEPSGDAFFSIVKLEEEKGQPRNPYINAGAILTSDHLPGVDAPDKIAHFQAFLGRASGLEAAAFPVNEAVFRSEAETGHRNRALAEIMRHHKVISDVEVAVETYFRQCAVTCTAEHLARIAMFLTNAGADPLTGEHIITPANAHGVLALMATSGMYDEVGSHAIEVGLPSKSSVSGAVLAIAPGRMAIAGFGPALGQKGNSIGAMKALGVLSKRLELSVFR